VSDKAKLPLDGDSTELCRVDEAEDVDDDDEGGAPVEVFSDELEVEPLIDN
jgi:hypothetical protein